MDEFTPAKQRFIDLVHEIDPDVVVVIPERATQDAFRISLTLGSNRRFVTVSEDDIRAAMRDIMLDVKLVAEPSGAVALAGWQRHAVALGYTGPAVAVLSGGNVEPALLREVLA